MIFKKIKDKIPFNWKYRTAKMFFVTARFFLFVSFFVSKKIASTQFARFIFQKASYPLAEKPSKGKRIIVFYDNLPMPDKDSASVRMHALLRILSEIADVAFVPIYHRFDGSTYEKSLCDLGIKIVSPMDFKRAFGSEPPEIAIFSYPIVAKYFQKIFSERFPNTKTIFDTVDVHYVRLQRESELTGSAEIAAEARDMKSVELETVRNVDQTWCVTEDDKNALLAEVSAAKIEVIPNIHEIFGSENKYSERHDILFIGGFRHRPNIDSVKFFVKEILPFIAEKRSDIKFHIVGSFPTEEVLALASDKVIVHGFVENVDNLFQSARVFVSPLRYGGGMKGKIGQALSYGLPVVTTSIGAEGMKLLHNETALIADEPKTFADEVLRVYDDSLLWQKLSDSGLKHLEETLSPAAVRKKVEKAFARL